VASNIVGAWILTLPAAAAIGALTYGVTRAFGTGALGPLVVSISMVMMLAAVFGRRFAQGSTPSFAQ
jgi:hypothetical protein